MHSASLSGYPICEDPVLAFQKWWLKEQYLIDIVCASKCEAYVAAQASLIWSGAGLAQELLCIT